MKPRIAIVGYGAMGRAIESIAKSENYIITDIFDLDHPIDTSRSYEFDVAIDFTYPDSVFDNIEKFVRLEKNVVLGTTGWYGRLNELQELINKSNIGLVWGSNFSIGVQILFRVVNFSSKLINYFTDYDIFLSETHHLRKKDSPSGTAESISRIILNNVDRKKKLLVGNSTDQINPEEFQISSLRGGEVFGKHNLYFDSLSDSIEINHSAKNRNGFAKGSLMAASWIKNQKGFFNFDQVFDQMIKPIS